MDVLNVANEIEAKIKLLDSAREALRKRVKAKIETAGSYEKLLAQTIIRARNGQPITIDQDTTTDIPVTILEKIAKGACWKEKMAMDEADALYRSILTQIEIIQSQLNGWQSINRYLSEK